MNTGGSAGRTQDFPTAQFYHVVTTDAHPVSRVRLAAGQLDALRAVQLERCRFGLGGAGGAAAVAVGRAVATSPPAAWRCRTRPAAASRATSRPTRATPTCSTPAPTTAAIVDKFNRRTGSSREVNPYPWFYSGEPSKEIKERWQWTYPDHLLAGRSEACSTSRRSGCGRRIDGGKTWTALSGDLTRHDPRTHGEVGRADHRRHERPRGVRA